MMSKLTIIVAIVVAVSLQVSADRAPFLLTLNVNNTEHFSFNAPFIHFYRNNTANTGSGSSAVVWETAHATSDVPVQTMRQKNQYYLQFEYRDALGWLIETDPIMVAAEGNWIVEVDVDKETVEYVYDASRPPAANFLYVQFRFVGNKRFEAMNLRLLWGSRPVAVSSVDLNYVYFELGTTLYMFYSGCKLVPGTPVENACGLRSSYTWQTELLANKTEFDAPPVSQTYNVLLGPDSSSNSIQVKKAYTYD
jgi:hypothetical protein